MRLKKLSPQFPNRRSFISKFGLSLAAISSASLLTSCNDAEIFIPKLLSSSEKPSKKRILSLIKATGEYESQVESLNQIAEDMLKSRLISDELKKMLTPEALVAVADEHLNTLIQFYKDNFTAEELKYLIEFYNSDVYKKLESISPNNRKSNTFPITVYLEKVRSIYRKAYRKTS